ncbi:MAG: aldo/keto reductase [Candidatus Lokiarchaeota archaeon]|nr:aldo/keto reductase [Candidatus Lokiarchaeota archaeon]
MTDLNINSSVRLNNEVNMPILGLGTWTLRGKSAYRAVLSALDFGYKLIDSASFYGNEQQIGEAIKKSKILRDDMFITTKVWNSDQGYDSTLAAFDRSLKLLKLDYIDLYLIHWPITGLRSETWKALEKIYDNGRVRAIGVSNFTIRHLDELKETLELMPTVNQVEFSPFLYQKELMEYCKSNKIVLEAYSPLTKTKKFNHPTLITIGQKYSKSPAQILIRWGLQHEIVSIPKSGDIKHLIDNMNVFDFSLDKSDMHQLDNLNENYRLIDDPNLID